MLSSSFFAEHDPEEYIPLLLNRFDCDNESQPNSETTCNIDDDDDETRIMSSHKSDDWLFSLVNWDIIFQNAASYLNIKFTDYDYDRYRSNGNDKLNYALVNNSSTVDTFNYFLSSLSNGKINMNSMNNKHDQSITNDYSINIYEIIYDRVAKSRLYSLQCILDDIYPNVNASVTRIIAEIVRFELAPDTIRHLLYKSIINEYNKECRPSLYKSLILVSNWFMYIVFFAIHIMWLQFVWIDFLKHFDLDPDTHPMDGETDLDSDAADITDINDLDVNARIFAPSISFKNATPFTILITLSKWTYFQWTAAVLWILLMLYMIVLYFIARRVDAFGDFLKKLQLTQLLKLGKHKSINYGTQHVSQIMLQYGGEHADSDRDGDHDNDNENDDITDDELFSESDLNEDAAVWDAYNRQNTKRDVMMTSDGELDVLSTKLVKQIESIYFQREHLILYTVISLVKMLIIWLYLSCLVIFFVIPSARYWYLWTIMIDAFAVYVMFKASAQIFCRKQSQNNSETERARSMRYVTDNGDVGILDVDGIFKHEWIVAMVNVVSISGLLMLTTLIISQYMSNYKVFVSQRLVYLQIMGAIEIVWFASQFLLWKLNFYGTIFYLLLLIPSILFGSAAFYALYEYYILSLVHSFLAVIFSCGEFHLVGPHDDDTTLDPSDWSVLGVLALLTKLFKFRMPQQTM